MQKYKKMRGYAIVLSGVCVIVFVLQSEMGVDFYSFTSNECKNAAYHDPPEEKHVTLRGMSCVDIKSVEPVKNPSGSHSREHHPQSHKSRAESVMRRLCLTLREINEIKHKSRKTETVAELLDEYRYVDEKEILWL